MDFFVKHAALHPQLTEPAPAVEASVAEGVGDRAAHSVEGSEEEPLAASSPAASSEEPPVDLQLDIGAISLEEVPIGQEVGAQALTKRLRAQISFQLSGQAAYLLNAQQSPYFVQVLACDLATGQTTVLAAEQQQLQSYSVVTVDQQRLQSYQLSFTATVEFGLPNVGRHQLLGTILLPDSNIVETALGSTFKVVP